MSTYRTVLAAQIVSKLVRTRSFGTALARPVKAEKPRKYKAMLKSRTTMQDALVKLNPKARSCVMRKWDLLNAFGGEFDSATIDALRQFPEVEHIEESQVMRIRRTQFVISPRIRRRIV